MLHIATAQSLHEIDALKQAWENLHQCGGTMFQSFAWNRLAAASFADREAPYVVYCETDSGAALVPAALTGDGITLLGETLFDYRDVLHAGDEQTLRHCWAKLAGLRLGLRFTSLYGDLPHWSALEPRLFTAAPLTSGLSADEFAHRHPRMGHKLRRLVRMGVELRRYRADETALLRWIYEQKAKQALTFLNLFDDPRRREFMVDAAALDPAACDIFTLEKEEVIAALVTFRDRRFRRFYTTWFHHHWAQYSPGMVLSYETARISLAEGLDCDFMTGEQPHKTRLATASVPLYRVEATAEMLERAASPAIVVPKAA